MLSFLLLLFSLAISDVQEVSLKNNFFSSTWFITKAGFLYSKIYKNQQFKSKSRLSHTLTEDFIISLSNTNHLSIPFPYIDKSKWEISLNNNEILLNKNSRSFINSHKNSKADKTDINIISDSTFEEKIIYMLNFGEKLTFKAISFIPNAFTSSQTCFKLFTGNSLNVINKKVKNGQFLIKSTLTRNSEQKLYFNFTDEISAQYIVITSKSEKMRIDEFDVYSEFLPPKSDFIRSSELKCIDHIEEHNKVTFLFDTVEVSGVKYVISEVVETSENSPYFEKHLEIECSNENAQIEYIDFLRSREIVGEKFKFLNKNERGAFVSRKTVFSIQNYIVDPMSVEVVKTTKETEILVRFNRPVELEEAVFGFDNLTLNGTTLLSDERTLIITTSSMRSKCKYQLSIEKVKDKYENELNTKVEFQYFSHNIIAAVRGEFSGTDAVFADETVSTDSFTIRFNVKDFKGVKNAVILHSEDGSSVVEITNDNRVKFTVRNASVTSKNEINKDTKFVTLVRERNAYIKIYFETGLDSASWDKNMDETVTIHNIILNKNDIIYNYVKIFNYAFTIDEVLTKEISLKNNFIERVFSISNNKVKTMELNNFRTDSTTTVMPEEGSEEFFFSIPESLKKLPIPIDRKDWKVTSNSEQNVTQGAIEGPVGNIIDGKLETIWHSKYNNKEGGHDERANKKDPFQVTFDLGKSTFFKSFSYTPRQVGVNGRINHYEVYTAQTIEELNEHISSMKYEVKGDFQYFTISPIYVNFSTTQFARFVALFSVDHDGYGSGSDFNLYNDYAPALNTDVCSSKFELDRFEESQTEKSEIVKFIYKPFLFRFIQFDVTVQYELQNGKHYIEKAITIKVPKDKQSQIKFDYLDLDRLVISAEDKEKSWTHPFVDSSSSGLSKYIITLGQPVYINTFFTGCRFPFSDNQIDGNIAYNRYQSGKTFSQLKLDENDNETYNCWRTVVGCARESSIRVVRNDFFDYISDISVGNKFRKQYNSWYDWMMTITESNILSSFKEIEKGCTQNGLPPLDSYVIDDGWNNYNYMSILHFVYDIERCGTSFNEEGFWTINNKFADGFAKPSAFTKSVSSNFGLWLGPRGGYNYNSQFGHMIESYGFGFYNSQSDDVDVASAKYAMKLKDVLNGMIEDYKVNYFKLDGWLLKGCKDESHDHIVGGYDDVYQFTDYWERYISVFESMRETAAKTTAVNDLWISLTCYVNPSPFHLQWANTIWLQISADVGYTSLSKDDSYADQMLNYRDEVYFEFVNNYSFMLPMWAIYNHDPIYGKTGTPLAGSLDDEEFRKFLMMCGMRGTSFFELYYSYNMLDEGDKWLVSAEVLRYIEGRHDVLRNSLMFGGPPSSGSVYGFSCWTKNKGTVCIRNPSGETKDFSFALDVEIGVPKDVGRTYRRLALGSRTVEDVEEGKEQVYGDVISVKMQPREVRIIDFEAVKDNQHAVVQALKTETPKEIRIRFNKRIIFDVENYVVDEGAVELESGKLRGDLRTVSLFLKSDLLNNTEHVVMLRNVLDSLGNALNENVTFTFMSENLIVDVRDQISPQKDVVLTASAVVLDSFTIHLDVSSLDQAREGVILRDEANLVNLTVVENHLVFQVDKVAVKTSAQLPTGAFSVTCVRERNTMLKVYVNGELSASRYVAGEDETRRLNGIVLCASGAEYRSLFVASYGYSYKQVMDVNEKRK